MAKAVLIPPLEATTAAAFADCALTCLATRYPYATQHLTRGDDDLALPHILHPLFYGSYDWHSSVHMHWSLIRLLRLDLSTKPALTPALKLAIHQHFAARFTAANAKREDAYLRNNRGFERPYGWAWLLQLHSELIAYSATHLPAKRWAAALAPMVQTVLLAWGHFLPTSHYPQRAGTHANSAFAMTLALRYANQHGEPDTATALRSAALRWYGDDKRYPAQYEPGGNDFLSGGLCEALLMNEVMGKNFPQWWAQFSPTSAAMRTWLHPVTVGSRSDGQLVHLDGLNLSRAWCLRGLAHRLPELNSQYTPAVERHLAASLPHVTGGDFVATHWLVSFALLALTDLTTSIRR